MERTVTKKNANMGRRKIAPAPPVAVSIAMGMNPRGSTTEKESESILAVLPGKNVSICGPSVANTNPCLKM